jgi:hypothetical protein
VDPATVAIGGLWFEDELADYQALHVQLSICEEKVAPSRRDETVKPLCKVSCRAPVPFEELPSYNNPDGRAVRYVNLKMNMRSYGSSVNFTATYNDETLGSNDVSIMFEENAAEKQKIAIPDIPAAATDEKRRPATPPSPPLSPRNARPLEEDYSIPPAALSTSYPVRAKTPAIRVKDYEEDRGELEEEDFSFELSKQTETAPEEIQEKSSKRFSMKRLTGSSTRSKRLTNLFHSRS